MKCGDNDKTARSEAAQRLANLILEWSKANEGKPIRIVGHSHGGNVGILASNLLSEQGVIVNTLITVATPVRGYSLKSSVGQHIHVYNDYDDIQISGGSMWLFGAAGRTFKDAENVKVKISFWQTFSRIENHSIMHNNPEVWDKYIVPNLN